MTHDSLPFSKGLAQRKWDCTNLDDDYKLLDSYAAEVQYFFSFFRIFHYRHYRSQLL
jgi:hypothetical protein